MSPVGAIMRPLPAAQPGDTLSRALDLMDGELVAICDGDQYLGSLTRAAVVRALAGGASQTAAAGDHAEPLPHLLPSASISEALRLFQSGGLGSAAVVDPGGRYRGVVSATEIVSPPGPPRPPMVGGMATPLGVYLTTGSISGGVHPAALALTGALMTTLLQGGLILSYLAATSAPSWSQPYVGNILPLALFGAGMQLLPLSGVHGAEHMVVHAIERGEPLRRDVVRRMPRVHPRCGTNFAAGMTLFLSLFTWRWTESEETRLLVAALITLFFWRTLGSFLQRFVTTKRPTDAQLDGAIRSAESLLKNYATASDVRTSPLKRIWHSGMPMVLAGSFAAVGVMWAIQALTGLDLGITVS